MSAFDLVALLPFLAVGAAAVALLVSIALRRSHAGAAALCGGGLLAALAAIPLSLSAAPRQVTPLLSIDRYALFYAGLIFAASLAVTILSYGYLERRKGTREEYYLMLLLGALGSAALAAASHFASFFLGLELLSVSLYVLIAYPRAGALPLEAGVKYLILAGASSAFLLFGMALLYARFGEMEFALLGSSLAADGALRDPYFLVGLALVLAGAGFKLGVVPFHMWTPDVYEGAPAPVTAFLATVSKGAMFALVLRYFASSGAYGSLPALKALGLVAVLSMLAGNLLALLQENVKRILAYSSIAHLGYLLVALLSGGTLALEAAAFYLAAYFVTSLGAFGVVAVCSGEGRDADSIDDYRGLFWRRPWLSGFFTATLLSLAGIPLTAGFVGKFYVLAAGVRAQVWLPLVVLVIGSVIGLFYYLRIVVALYAPVPEGVHGHASRSLAKPSVSGSLVLAVLGLLLVGLGVYPGPLVRLIRAAVSGVFPGL